VATSTSNFGVGKRETHDASGFYARFVPPTLSDDATVLPPTPVDQPLVCGDSRSMTTVADGTVALVVTSPPYFAGKQYEEELTRDEVPSSYVEYLTMLRDVFADCVRVLEPGGRIAVNVANLGRKPYRSLSSDVIHILQDDLGLLLRGEIIWRKAAGATGSCAWGSYRSPANPVFRDVTERIVIASKGRFDRALDHHRRAKAGLPNRATLNTDDFLSLTLDMWDMPTESAKRVGHPAPFPIELADRLIRMYTYEHDLVLDPFLGSGSTVVAAARLSRRYVGYDLDPEYIDIAHGRLRHEGQRTPRNETDSLLGTKALAEAAIAAAGFVIIARDRRVPRTGVSIDIEAIDTLGRTWFFKTAGPNTTHRPGLLTPTVVWDVLGRLHALRDRTEGVPVVLLTPQLPDRRSEPWTALHSAGRHAYFDAIDLHDIRDQERLRAYGLASAVEPAIGWWSADELR
jgi:DNA modification methylase